MSGRDKKKGEVGTRLLLAFFLAAGSFLLAHTINGVVAYSLERPAYQMYTVEPGLQSEAGSQASRRLARSLAQDVLSSGLFPVPPAPRDPMVLGSGTAPPPPPLNLSTKVSLLGVVRGPQNDDRAIIEELSNKKQGLYRVSQRIPDVGELATIESDRVLFREGEQEEWLELAIVKQRAAMTPFPQSQLTAEATAVRLLSQSLPTRRTVDRAQIINVTATPEAYLSEARFLPHFNRSSQFDGFQVDGIKQIGLLENAGLQNGDVLSSINGVEIRDPARLWEVFKQLQHERTIRFNVIRQGAPLTLFVQISG